MGAEWQLSLETGDGPLGAAPRSRASYLLQLELSGESSGHSLDEVGEGEGTTAVTAGQGERGTVRGARNQRSVTGRRHGTL